MPMWPVLKEAAMLSERAQRTISGNGGQSFTKAVKASILLP